MILKALYGKAVQLAHWKSEKKWRVPIIRNGSSDGQYKTASNCDSESFFKNTNHMVHIEVIQYCFRFSIHRAVLRVL